MCRDMRHHLQPTAGMAPILDAAPHTDEACAAAINRIRGSGCCGRFGSGVLRHYLRHYLCHCSSHCSGL